jgi:hypothetical protein
MGKGVKVEGLVKLFERVIDPYGEGLWLAETVDGFIGNGHWAVRKELLEPLRGYYEQYVKAKSSMSIKGIVENARRGYEEFGMDVDVVVYDGFDYYAVRTVEDWRKRKLKFYVLDIYELFRKVLLLKDYADFIEGVIGDSYVWRGYDLVRRVYYTRWDEGRKVMVFFVWYWVKGGEEEVVALCTGYNEFER